MWLSTANARNTVSKRLVSHDNCTSDRQSHRQYVNTQDLSTVGRCHPSSDPFNGKYIQSYHIDSRPQLRQCDLPILATSQSAPISLRAVPADTASLVLAVDNLRLHQPTTPSAPPEQSQSLRATDMTAPFQPEENPCAQHQPLHGTPVTLLRPPGFEVTRGGSETTHVLTSPYCEPHLRATTRGVHPYAPPGFSSRNARTLHAETRSSLAQKNPILANLLLQPITTASMPTGGAVTATVPSQCHNYGLRIQCNGDIECPARLETREHGHVPLDGLLPQHSLQPYSLGRGLNDPLIPIRVQPAGQAPQMRPDFSTTSTTSQQSFRPDLANSAESFNPAMVCNNEVLTDGVEKCSFVEIFSDDTPAMVCCGIRCKPSRVFIDVQNINTALGSLHTQKGICIEYRLDLAYTELPQSGLAAMASFAERFVQSELEENLVHGQLLLPGLRDRTYRITSVISTVCANGVESSTTHTMTGTTRFAYCLPYASGNQYRRNTYRRPLISPTMVDPAVAHKYFWFFTPIPDSAVATLLYRKDMTRLHYLHVCGMRKSDGHDDPVVTGEGGHYTRIDAMGHCEDPFGGIGCREEQNNSSDACNPRVSVPSDEARVNSAAQPPRSKSSDKEFPPGTKVTPGIPAGHMFGREQVNVDSDDQVASSFVASSTLLVNDQLPNTQRSFDNRAGGTAVHTEGLSNLQRASAMSDHMIVSATSLLNNTQNCTPQLQDSAFRAPRVTDTLLGGLRSLQVTLEESGPFGNLVPLTYRSYKIIFQV